MSRYSDGPIELIAHESGVGFIVRVPMTEHATRVFQFNDFAAARKFADRRIDTRKNLATNPLLRKSVEAYARKISTL